MTNEANEETRPLCRPCLAALDETGGTIETIERCARCGAEGVATRDVAWDSTLDADAAFLAMARSVDALLQAKRVNNAETTDISVARVHRRERESRKSLELAASKLRLWLKERGFDDE